MKIRVKNEKKAIIIAFVFLFSVIYGYWYFIVSPVLGALKFSNQASTFVDTNEEPIFKIKEIILYSSAYGVDKSEGGTLQDMDVHQFTDISVLIDNKSYISDLSNKNTVSELYIDNIRITKKTDIGESSINYKNPYMFGKFSDTISPTNRIDFNILHTNADNANNDFSTPTFFTDCSNPITLGYMNKNVKTNCDILSSKEKVDFNGKLLKIADVKPEDISYELSFSIHIKNSLEEAYVYGVNLNIPLQDDNSSIYDGYVFKVMHNQSKSYYFLREDRE